MSEILFSIFIMLVEAYLYYRLMNNSLPYKYNPKSRIVVFIFVFGMALIRYLLAEVAAESFIPTLLRIFLILSLFAISFCFYEGSTSKKVLIPMVYYLLVVLSELLVIFTFMLLFGKSPLELKMNDYLYQCMAVISRGIAALLIEVICRGKNIVPEFPKRFQKEILFISGLDLAFIMYAITIWKDNFQVKKISADEMVGTMFVVVFMISIITIVLLYRLAKQAEKEIENNLRLHHIESENKLNRDMTSVVDSLRSLRHDMNTHMGVLKGLLQLHQYDDLSEYLDSMCEELNTANNFLVIENKVLSVLINSKITKAVDLGIDFQPSVSIKSIHISDRDMCALIGNIIDNAIEAAEQVEDNKYIRFQMEEKYNHFTIYCENTFAVKPIKKGESFVTTKSDSSFHGIGTKTIKSIVDKYHGYIDILVAEQFIVNIDLPIKNLN